MQVLITGANRGIGLEFTRQYLQQGWQVIACCREPGSADELQQLAGNQLTAKQLKIEQLDVADFDQIDRLAAKLKGQALDILINNAGIYHGSSLQHVDYQGWAESFKVNSMAPLKMTQAFLTHIAASQGKKVATLTSKMGSIDDNTSGGSYIYRSSKTAVNMVMKSLALDLQPQGIAAVTLHPGWVQTDMGGSNALINTQQSVAGMRQVIDALKLASSGRFVAYDGNEIAW